MQPVYNIHKQFITCLQNPSSFFTNLIAVIGMILFPAFISAHNLTTRSSVEGDLTVPNGINLVTITANGGDSDTEFTAYPNLSNCNLWGNVSSAEISHFFGGTTTITNCIVKGSSIIGNLNTDLLYVDPNSGNLRLKPGSSAINAGGDAANNKPFNLNSNLRKVGVIDIGTYEFQGNVNQATTTTVTSSLSSGCANTSVTFTASVTSGANTVTTGTISFTEGPTVLAGNVAVNASGQAVFSTSSLAAGTHIILATYNAATGFSSSNVSVTQTVNALPVVSFSGLPAPVCVNTAVITLTGSPTGGTFSGPGISGNTFNPAKAGTGLISIMYSYTDGNGCSSNSSHRLDVKALTVVSFSGLPASLCVNAGVVTLTGSPINGIFSGSGIIGDTFDPARAGPGTAKIEYSYTGVFGCPANVSDQYVVVNALPIVSFSGLPPSVCVNAGTIALTGSPLGGTFRGPGISDNTFDPATAGPGVITIFYTAANGCGKESIAQKVTVNALPVVSFTGLSAPVCVNTAVITLTGSPTGGTFSGPGIIGNTFNPAKAGTGLISIMYSYTDGNGCSSKSSQQITVEGKAPPTIITKNITVQLTTGGNVIIAPADINNGSYDACGIKSFSLDKTTFYCNNIGANTVKLTVTDVNGNIASATAIVTVVDKAPPTIITKNITVQLTTGGNVIITPADVNNGSYDACGIKSFSLDKTTFYCNNVGANIVTLTATDANGNKSSATAMVTVQDKALPTVITKNISVQLNASGTVTIADRNVDNGSYDACGLILYKLDKTSFDCTNVGTNTVTLTVTDVNGNKASGTAVVTVLPSRVWVLDKDADGYYTGNPITQCSSPGIGYVIKTNQQPGDCNDNDPAISPAAVEVCGNMVDDNCNGVIDEAVCYPCQNGTNLTTTNVTTTSAQLSWTAIANPVQWQLKYKTIKQGSKWVDVLLTGNIRMVKLTGLLSNQNYHWHLRAKCGTIWTAYSSAISFKTIASSTLSLAREVPAIEDIVDAGSATIKLHPNPTTGLFNLELQLADKSFATALINLRDISGRIVYTEKTYLLKGGTLSKNITVPGNAVSGMYLVEVLVDGKVYNSKLVLIK